MWDILMKAEGIRKTQFLKLRGEIRQNGIMIWLSQFWRKADQCGDRLSKILKMKGILNWISALFLPWLKVEIPMEEKSISIRKLHKLSIRLNLNRKFIQSQWNTLRLSLLPWIVSEIRLWKHQAMSKKLILSSEPALYRQNYGKERTKSSPWLFEIQEISLFSLVSRTWTTTTTKTKYRLLAGAIKATNILTLPSPWSKIDS